MDSSNIFVSKATGEKEPFSEEKVRSSIQRAGLTGDLEEQIVTHVRSILYPNIPTSEIYQHIIEFLNRSSYPAGSARYSLRRAIMEFGPTGYPFEKFVAAVLQNYGYSVMTNVIMQGKCVQHEVDVIAEKEGRRYMIEAKFHQRPGARSDVKVALYTYARFRDLGMFDQPWLVTNTKVTSDAIAYARCMQMHILAWSYPKEGNLRELIEKAKLHPITALTKLSAQQKAVLLQKGLVLCKNLQNVSKQELRNLTLSEQQIATMLEEALAVCI